MGLARFWAAFTALLCRMASLAYSLELDCALEGTLIAKRASLHLGGLWLAGED